MSTPPPFLPLFALAAMRTVSEPFNLLDYAQPVTTVSVTLTLSSNLNRNTVDGITPWPFQVDYRPNEDFSYERAKRKLITMQSAFQSRQQVKFMIPGESTAYEDEQYEFGFTGKQGRFLQVSSLLNFDNRASIGCVGAVLTYLQRRRNAEYLYENLDAQDEYPIAYLEMFTLKQTM